MSDGTGYDLRYSEDMDRHVDESGQKRRKRKDDVPYWDSPEGKEIRERNEKMFPKSVHAEW